MQSVKLMELIVLALFGWLMVAFTNAHGETMQSLEPFSLKPLQVTMADVPSQVRSPETANVTIDVIYADSCYQHFHPLVRYVDGSPKIIEIQPYAVVMRGECLDRVRNLEKSVPLTALEKGPYKVRILSVGHDPIERPLIIQ